MKTLIAKALGIGRVIWEFIRPIVFGATADSLEKLLPTAKEIVAGLDSSPGSGDEKRKQALEALKAAAITAGLAVGTGVLNLAIEMALNKLREGAAK